MKRVDIKQISFIENICKAASLVTCTLALLILFSFAPMLFGVCPFAVKQSDCTEYKVNDLAYYSYIPADTYFPGDHAAVKTEHGMLVLTLTEADTEARVWHTAGDFPAYAALPYEYLEGRVRGFRFANMGFLAENGLLFAGGFFAAAALFLWLSRSLPKKLYAPRYGKDENEQNKSGGKEAEHGADT